MAEERVQRRLAAILTADVVGYSHFMEVDEEGTLARLKSLREELFDPKVAEYHGRIVKIIGDGVLVEFASAVDAMRCAVEVQHDLTERNSATPENHRLELRVGINVGDIIIEGEDIYGDGVNVAARLEGLAEPGGVCISGTVHDAIGNKIPVQFEYMGEKEVKNIEKPVRTFRLIVENQEREEQGSYPRDAKRNRRWAVGAAVAASLVAVGIVTWIILDKEQAASSGSTRCTDEYNLTVSCSMIEEYSNPTEGER